MRWVKLFESFDEIINIVDDISAYVPTTCSHVYSKWIKSTGEIKTILTDVALSDHIKKDPLYKTKFQYIKYYKFSFREMSNFFRCESDITNRAHSYNLKFIVCNAGKLSEDDNCSIIFFKEEDYKKIDMQKFIKNFDEIGYDILLEEDVKVNREEFDIIYESDEIIAIKPKTYKAMIKYSSDTNWQLAFKKNQKWIDKYISRGSYYGGSNWYKSKTITKDVKTWYSSLLKLPPKKSETEVKEFIKDFPRYLMYIVIFKNLPMEDEMKKIFMLYDLSRGEYGELPQSFSSGYVMNGSYYGDLLDSTHNQIKVVNGEGKRITFQDIWKKHRFLFSKVFHEIEEDQSAEKDKIYDLIGFWSDKGGEYSKNPLTFVRDTTNRLLITRPNLIRKDDDGVTRFRSLGKYDDPDFDYWELDEEKPDEKQLPKHGFKDYFQSISDNVKKLQGDLDKYKTGDGEIKL